MKKIITIAIIIFVSFNLKAQEIIKGTYYAEPELSKFAGQWTFGNDTVTFTINLRLEKYYFKRAGVYMDKIQGDYTYKKNGVSVNSSVNLTGESSAIYGGNFVDKSASKTKIRFLFTDLGKKSKRGDVTFELSSTNPNQAKWTLANTEGVRFGTYDYGFSIPRIMVMKKVN